MKSRVPCASAGLSLLLCAASVWAMQNGLASLGLSSGERDQIAKSWFSSSQGDAASLLNWLSGPVRTALRGRDAAARTRIVREAGLEVKRMVMAPAFQKMHDEWIRQSLNAVNHGIRLDTPPSDAPATMQSAQNQMAAGMAEGLKQVPAEHLGILMDSEIDSLKDSRDAADKNKLARVRQIRALLASKPAEAKTQFIGYMVAKLGGPADEAGIQAAVRDASKAKAEQERREQQANYNKYNLKAQLRDRLSAFLAEGNTVDFAAKTQLRGTRQVFVNPAYEAKSSSWKALYRLGREPAMAALEIAGQWRREL